MHEKTDVLQLNRGLIKNFRPSILHDTSSQPFALFTDFVDFKQCSFTSFLQINAENVKVTFVSYHHDFWSVATHSDNTPQRCA